MERLALLEELAQAYVPKDLQFSSTTSFEDLNMDSYDIVDFLLKVEEQFHVVLENDAMMNIHTMQDVLNEIDNCQKEAV